MAVWFSKIDVADVRIFPLAYLILLSVVLCVQMCRLCRVRRRDCCQVVVSGNDTLSQWCWIRRQGQ